MENITRRDFTRSLVGATVLNKISLKPPYSKTDINLNDDWDKALEEYNLRQETSELMEKYNQTVAFTVQFDSKNIRSSDISLENLKEIRDDLRKSYHIPGGRGHTFHSRSHLS